MKKIKMTFNKYVAFVLAAVIMCVNIGAFQVLSAERESGIYVVHTVGRGSPTIYNLYHDIESNSVSPTSIFGTDDRIKDPSNMAVVRLSIGGTGFIVGPHTIATNAHAIYGDKKFFDDMTISIVGENGEVEKTISPKFFHIPYEYYNSGKQDYDFGLIEVADDLSEYGCFYLGTILDDYSTNAPRTDVSISGFPQRENEEWGGRYIGQGRIVKQDEYWIYYTVDTSGGNSGSPVYVTIQTNYGTTYNVAIGIHAYAGANAAGTDYNKGIKVNSRILQFYLNNGKKVYDKP